MIDTEFRQVQGPITYDVQTSPAFTVNREGATLSDADIIAIQGERPEFITPFHSSLINNVDGHRIISKGLSSAGYDATLADELLLIKPDGMVDPKMMQQEHERLEVNVDENGSRYVVLPPKGFALGHTVERFSLPRNVSAQCIGKSTYARSGIHVIVTPLEPGWAGQVTLEISNLLDVPVKLYVDEGICQFVFLLASGDVLTDYSQRNGKYQDQTGVTLPKV